MLDSNYIRAWCEEWALPPHAWEQLLMTYARVDDPQEVLASMAGLANAQRFRLHRTGKLITLSRFLEDSSSLPEMGVDCDWNAPTEVLADRFF